MRAALRGTKFENAHMIGISACVGGEKVAAVGGSASPTAFRQRAHSSSLDYY